MKLKKAQAIEPKFYHTNERQVVDKEGRQEEETKRLNRINVK